MLTRVDRDLIDISEGATVEQLMRILDTKYKGRRFDNEKTKFMINNQFVGREHGLAEGDEVSVFQTLKGR